MSKPDVNSDAWWAERGVAAEVRAARPYVRWTIADVDPVRQAYGGLSAGQRKTLVKWARQSDGLVIYRHSFERVPRGELRDVYPEIRPDRPVERKVTWHYHGPPRSRPPLNPNTGKPLPGRHVHPPESMAAHIARSRDPDDHGGVNDKKVHSHREVAKYLFPPSGTVSVPWVHRHRDEWWRQVYVHISPGADENGVWNEPELTDAEIEQLEARFAAWLHGHVTRHHPEIDAVRVLEGTWDYVGDDIEHEHSVKIKRGGEQLAKRIDVHPLVWEHEGFERAERVFFAIEGCIKADAILSALLKAGEPPAVFSVPSVSLWEATYPVKLDDGEDESYDGDDRFASARYRGDIGDELAAFVGAHLRGKLVLIVPDADAHTKDEVMTQALLCRSTLCRLGARAEIVLPPDDRLDQGIKGVDDYLGKGGGTLTGMVWYRKEPPDQKRLDEWLRSHQASWRADGLQRAVRTLQALATHAGDNGNYSSSARLLARASSSGRQQPKRLRETQPEAIEQLKRDREAARRAFQRGINDLLEIDAITTNKPLTVRRDRWLQTRTGARQKAGLQWDEDGVVITLHQDLRAPAERHSASELWKLNDRSPAAALPRRL